MPRNNGIKTGRWSVRFSSGSPHHGPNLHSEANLREILAVWQRSLHALSILKKHMTEFLGINFGRFCRSTVLMVNCCAPLSHSTADRRFVLGQMANNQSRSMWAMNSRFVTSAFHCLHELDRQMQSS